MWYARAWAYNLKHFLHPCSFQKCMRTVQSNCSINKGNINSSKNNKWHYPNSIHISVIHHVNKCHSHRKNKHTYWKKHQVCALCPTFHETYLVLCRLYCMQYPVAHLNLSMPKWMCHNSSSYVLM